MQGRLHIGYKLAPWQNLNFLRARKVRTSSCGGKWLLYLFGKESLAHRVQSPRDDRLRHAFPFHCSVMEFLYLEQKTATLPEIVCSG